MDFNNISDNDQRTYIKDFDGRYVLISRIDNTLMIASIHGDDKTDTDILFSEIGY